MCGFKAPQQQIGDFNTNGKRIMRHKTNLYSSRTTIHNQLFKMEQQLKQFKRILEITEGKKATKKETRSSEIKSIVGKITTMKYDHKTMTTEDYIAHLEQSVVELKYINQITKQRKKKKKVKKCKKEENCLFQKNGSSLSISIDQVKQEIPTSFSQE